MGKSKMSWTKKIIGTGLLMAAGLGLGAYGNVTQPVEQAAQVRPGSFVCGEFIAYDSEGVAEHRTEVMYWCGSAHYFAGELEPAKEIFTLLAASEDGDAVSSAHHYLGMIYLMENRMEEAVEHFQIASESWEDQPMGLYVPFEIGEALHFPDQTIPVDMSFEGETLYWRERGVLEDTSEELKARLERLSSDEHVAELITQHKAYLEYTADMDKLLPACRIKDMRPSNDGQLNELYSAAVDLYFSGDFEAAEEAFSELAELDFCNLSVRSAHQFLGMFNLMEGNIELAKEDFKIAFFLGGYSLNTVAGLTQTTKPIVPRLLDDNPDNDPTESEIAEAIEFHLEYISGRQNK